MQKNGDDFEPIIAPRRSRAPLREDEQPLWRLALLLGAGLVVALLLVSWLMGRTPSDRAATTEESLPQAEVSPPEIRVEEESVPPPKEAEASEDLARTPAPPAPTEPTVGTEPAAGTGQPAVPETPAVVADDADTSPSAPTPVSVRLVSPDEQVSFEFRGVLDPSTSATGKTGDVVTLAPGAYRVVASGARLEKLEQEMTLDGEHPLELMVELCAQPEQELETLAGRIIEERACASTTECETMFMVMSEQAEQLVKDSAFRTQECAKWRSEAAPEGKWTLDTKCDGATQATTCRIEISAGTCAVTEPRRSARGGACPRSEIM